MDFIKRHRHILAVLFLVLPISPSASATPSYQLEDLIGSQATTLSCGELEDYLAKWKELAPLEIHDREAMGNIKIIFHGIYGLAEGINQMLYDASVDIDIGLLVLQTYTICNAIDFDKNFLSASGVIYNILEATAKNPDRLSLKMIDKSDINDLPSDDHRSGLLIAHTLDKSMSLEFPVFTSSCMDSSKAIRQGFRDARQYEKAHGSLSERFLPKTVIQGRVILSSLKSFYAGASVNNDFSQWVSISKIGFSAASLDALTHRKDEFIIRYLNICSDNNDKTAAQVLTYMAIEGGAKTND